jgi:16S rRNA (cytosine1402-N4)-methyltransferase
MLAEVMKYLDIKPNGIYIDGTLGRGGHSKEILKRLTSGHLIAFDKDETAIVKSRTRLLKISNNFTLIHSDFKNMKNELDKIGISSVDGILLDLGMSSPQIDDQSRGFSYHNEGPLDMRMDQTQTLSA